MPLCDEKKFTDTLEVLIELGSTAKELGFSALESSTEVIDQLARTKKLFAELGNLKDKIIDNSLQSSLCFILNKYASKELIDTIERKAEEISIILGELDDNLSSVSGVTLEEIETEMDSIMNEFYSRFDIYKEGLMVYIKQLFSVLLTIGANQQIINEALEDIEFQPNIKDYLLDVFSEILDLTLENLEE